MILIYTICWWHSAKSVDLGQEREWKPSGHFHHAKWTNDVVLIDIYALRFLFLENCGDYNYKH
jgi:hypothetical protein